MIEIKIRADEADGFYSLVEATRRAIARYRDKADWHDECAILDGVHSAHIADYYHELEMAARRLLP